VIDPAELAGLPPPDDASETPVRRRPRNYLATGERRRLLWRFMPVALATVLVLTWVERTWFPRRDPRPAAPVDTRLETVRGPAPGADEVIIEPEPEAVPDDAAPAADALGAPASLLAKVRDDTFFRDADTEAWEQLFLTLRENRQPARLRSAAPRVSFSELFGQPRSFRGRLVRLRGTLHRLERLAAPDNNYGIDHYWQGWLELEGGPATPVVIHFLTVPEGMPTGMSIDEPVDVVGYFLKRYAYQAADTIRVAPLVVAHEPVRRPPSAAAKGAASLGTWALVSMAALVAATLLGIGLAGRRDGRRGAEPPVDLSAALAGHEPFSAAEVLGRLGADAETRHREGEAS
jgi:hypothetical protein